MFMRSRRSLLCDCIKNILHSSSSGLSISRVTECFSSRDKFIIKTTSSEQVRVKYYVGWRKGLWEKKGSLVQVIIMCAFSLFAVILVSLSCKETLFSNERLSDEIEREEEVVPQEKFCLFIQLFSRRVNHFFYLHSLKERQTLQDNERKRLHNRQHNTKFLMDFPNSLLIGNESEVSFFPLLGMKSRQDNWHQTTTATTQKVSPLSILKRTDMNKLCQKSLCKIDLTSLRMNQRKSNVSLSFRFLRE